MSAPMATIAGGQRNGPGAEHLAAVSCCRTSVALYRRVGATRYRVAAGRASVRVRERRVARTRDAGAEAAPTGGGRLNSSLGRLDRAGSRPDCTAARRAARAAVAEGALAECMAGQREAECYDRSDCLNGLHKIGLLSKEHSLLANPSRPRWFLGGCGPIPHGSRHGTTLTQLFTAWLKEHR
jgi:hypothetical protein